MTAPTATFLFLCYRQEAYVRDALRSALAQDYRPLEILISDDASPDATFDIVCEEVAAYRGDADIVVNRNAENIGALEHQNRMMARVRGDYVVLGCGDDVFMPERARLLVEAWQRTGALVVASNIWSIDRAGQVIGRGVGADFAPDLSLEYFTRIGVNACCMGASLAWHREVFDLFGPIEAARSPYNGDFVIPFRGLLLGGNAFVNQTLVHYRVHEASNNFKVLNHADARSKEESTFALFNTQNLYLLETLNEFRALRPDDARLPAAERNLVGLIGNGLSMWAAKRNAMLLDGLDSAWRGTQSP